MGLMQVIPSTYATLRASYGLGDDPYARPSRELELGVELGQVALDQWIVDHASSTAVTASAKSAQPRRRSPGRARPRVVRA